jgi:hypothetical protein
MRISSARRFSLISISAGAAGRARFFFFDFSACGDHEIGRRGERAPVTFFLHRLITDFVSGRADHFRQFSVGRVALARLRVVQQSHAHELRSESSLRQGICAAATLNQNIFGAQPKYL